MKKLACITVLLAVCLTTNAKTDSFNPLTTKKSEIVTVPGKISPFCMAIVKGDFETVKKLVSMGADVNKADGNGMTPLMFAARYNKVDILELLIAEGADLRAKNVKNGFTALKYAELSNAEQAYRILERALGA